MKKKNSLGIILKKFAKISPQKKIYYNEDDYFLIKNKNNIKEITTARSLSNQSKENIASSIIKNTFFIKKHPSIATCESNETKDKYYKKNKNYYLPSFITVTERKLTDHISSNSKINKENEISLNLSSLSQLIDKIGEKNVESLNDLSENIIKNGKKTFDTHLTSEFINYLSVFTNSIIQIFNEIFIKKILIPLKIENIGTLFNNSLQFCFQKYNSFIKEFEKSILKKNINKKFTEKKFIPILEKIIKYYKYIFSYDEENLNLETEYKENILLFKKELIKNINGSEYLKIFQVLEETFKQMCNEKWESKSKNKILIKEIEQLKESFIKQNVNNNRNNQNLIQNIINKNKNIILNEKIFDDQKKLDEFYKKNLDEFKYEIKEKSDKIAKYKQKLSSYKNITLQYENQKTNNLNNKNDKESQCNFFLKSCETNDFFQNFMNIDSNINLTGKIQEKEWVYFIINQIYNDRLISEIHDKNLKINKFNLNAYLIQWFIKQFGSKKYAEIMISDFLITIRKFHDDSEIIRIFIDLSGLNNLKPKLEKNIQFNKTSNSEKIRQTVYKSSYSFSIFLKISKLIIENRVLDPKEKYYPFFYYPVKNNKDLLEFSFCKSIMEKLLKLEKFSDEKIYFIIKKLNDSLNVYENAYLVKYGKFIRFVLNQILENKIIEFEKLYTLIELNTEENKSKNFNLDDFYKIIIKIYPDINIRIKELCFSKIIEKNTDNSQLHTIFLNIIPILLNDNVSDENDSNQNLFDKFNENKDSPNSPLLHSSISINSAELHSSFNDISSLNYLDLINYSGLLEESYLILSNYIIECESKNEIIKFFHEDLKEDLFKIPKSVKNNYNIEIYNKYDKKYLNKILDICWKKLRNILSYCK